MIDFESSGNFLFYKEDCQKKGVKNNDSAKKSWSNNTGF